MPVRWDAMTIWCFMMIMYMYLIHINSISLVLFGILTTVTELTNKDFTGFPTGGSCKLLA